jgi:hypothetical protein
MYRLDQTYAADFKWGKYWEQKTVGLRENGVFCFANIQAAWLLKPYFYFCENRK